MVKSIKINHFKKNRYQKTILYQKEIGRGLLLDLLSLV